MMCNNTYMVFEIVDTFLFPLNENVLNYFIWKYIFLLCYIIFCKNIQLCISQNILGFVYIDFSVHCSYVLAFFHKYPFIVL